MEYKAKEIAKLEKAMSKSFGEHLGVYHEIVTEDNLHIDCEVFKTNIEGEEFYTVVTLGLSKYKMEGSAPGYEHIELMFCMPISWDYNKTVWPMNLLKMIAKTPIKYNWTIGPFHTMDLNETCIVDKFSDVFIEFPRNFMPDETIFKLGKKEVRVLQVYPIFKDELEEIFKENEDVMERIVENTIFDENRESVV